MRKGHLDPKCCCLCSFPNNVDDIALLILPEDGTRRKGAAKWSVVISSIQWWTTVKKLVLFVLLVHSQNMFLQRSGTYDNHRCLCRTHCYTLTYPKLYSFGFLCPCSGKSFVHYTERQCRRQEQAITSDLKFQTVAAISLGAQIWWIFRLFSHRFPMLPFL